MKSKPFNASSLIIGLWLMIATSIETRRHALSARRNLLRVAENNGVRHRGEADHDSRHARPLIFVTLPDYFEKLTRAERRTVMLTNVDGFDRLAIQRQAGRQVAKGKLMVIANASSAQAFTWEVKAVRADIASLEVEP